jgi:hypothetical protein
MGLFYYDVCVKFDHISNFSWNILIRTWVFEKGSSYILAEHSDLKKAMTHSFSVRMLLIEKL